MHHISFDLDLDSDGATWGNSRHKIDRFLEFRIQDRIARRIYAFCRKVSAGESLSIIGKVRCNPANYHQLTVLEWFFAQDCLSCCMVHERNMHLLWKLESGTRRQFPEKFTENRWSIIGPLFAWTIRWRSAIYREKVLATELAVQKIQEQLEISSSLLLFDGVDTVFFFGCSSILSDQLTGSSLVTLIELLTDHSLSYRTCAESTFV